MEDTLKVFASLGVGGILAGMMFWYFRLDRLRCEELQAGHVKAYAETTNVLMQLVKDNIAATTVNTTTVAALHRRLDDEKRIETLQDQIEEMLSRIGRRDDDQPPTVAPAKPGH